MVVYIRLVGRWTPSMDGAYDPASQPSPFPYSMFRALAKFHGDTGKEFLAGTVNTLMDAIVMSMVRDGPLVSSIIWVRWAADGRCTGVSSIAEVGYSTSWTVVRGCPSMSSQTAHPPTRSFTRICPPRWMGVMW